MSKIDNERKRSFIEISIYRILAKLHSTETKWSFRLEVSLECRNLKLMFLLK